MRESLKAQALVNCLDSMRNDINMRYALRREKPVQIERGVEVGGIRIRLILQSADVGAHSAMSDAAEGFGVFADDVSAYAREALKRFVATLPPSRIL